jgi:hypothetical protein
MQILFSIIWIIVGIILAVPYVWLAGGYSDPAVIITFFGPGVCLLLFFLYHISKVLKEIKPFFWFLLVYSFLPVLLNGVSMLLKWMGVRGAADFIFNHRYESLAIIFILLAALLAGGLIGSGLNTIRKRINNNINKPGAFSGKITKLFRKKEENSKKADTKLKFVSV